MTVVIPLTCMLDCLCRENHRDLWLVWNQQQVCYHHSWISSSFFLVECQNQFICIANKLNFYLSMVLIQQCSFQLQRFQYCMCIYMHGKHILALLSLSLSLSLLTNFASYFPQMISLCYACLLKPGVPSNSSSDSEDDIEAPLLSES